MFAAICSFGLLVATFKLLLLLLLFLTAAKNYKVWIIYPFPINEYIHIFPIKNTDGQFFLYDKQG